MSKGDEKISHRSENKKVKVLGLVRELSYMYIILSPIHQIDFGFLEGYNSYLITGS